MTIDLNENFTPEKNLRIVYFFFKPSLMVGNIMNLQTKQTKK